MFEELFETVFPGGALLAAGVAVGAAFGRQLRPAAKQAIRWSMTAGAALQEVAAEAYEASQDLVAEARYEHEQEAREAAGAGGAETHDGVPPRRGARRSRQATGA